MRETSGRNASEGIEPRNRCSCRRSKLFILAQTTVWPPLARQGGQNPTGSEAATRCPPETMGTRETPGRPEQGKR